MKFEHLGYNEQWKKKSWSDRSKYVTAIKLLKTAGFGD